MPSNVTQNQTLHVKQVAAVFMISWTQILGQDQLLTVILHAFPPFKRQDCNSN